MNSTEGALCQSVTLASLPQTDQAGGRGDHCRLWQSTNKEVSANGLVSVSEMLQSERLLFTELAPLGRFSHIVSLSACPFAPSGAVFLRPFIGSNITWSVPRPLIGPPNTLPPLGNLETWKLWNLVSRELGHSETWNLPPLIFFFNFCPLWYRCYYPHQLKDSLTPHSSPSRLVQIPDCPRHSCHTNFNQQNSGQGW